MEFQTLTVRLVRHWILRLPARAPHVSEQWCLDYEVEAAKH